MKNDTLKGQYRINEQIRAKEVRIVGDDIEPKVYPIFQALKLAEEKELDLVEISPNALSLIHIFFETMVHADGVGLAAPQIGLPIRVVTITLDPLSEDYPEFKGFNKAYINPHILEIGGEEVSMEEGCLSLPGIHETVKRGNKIRVKYMDEDFVEHEEEVEGYLARVMQHEFDHLDGKMFISCV